MRRIHFALFVLVLLVAQPLLAGTYYVGNCKVKKGYYTTIGAAVTAATSGSTIEACPGIYYEQVIIDKALTLEAIPNWPTGPVIISDVGVSLATATSIYWGTVAPQVQVTAGPVNITNINVEEFTDGNSCPATEIAIFYGSGSSGTVKGVETNGNCYLGSIGIEAENGAGATESVTIEDNEIHAGSIAGIAVGSDQVPTSSLTAVVSNNYVWTSPVGIMSLGNSQGSISNNFIASYPAGGTGVWAGSCCVPVSGNWIEAQNIGVDIEGTIVSVTSNRIFASSTTGINIGVGGVTVKGNGISYTLGTAIEFNCTTSDTVTGNTVIDANVGLDEVPTGFTGFNTLYNVGTRTTGCSSDEAQGRDPASGTVTRR